MMTEKFFYIFGGVEADERETIRGIVEKEKMLLSLQVMAHFLLVLILKIYII